MVCIWIEMLYSTTSKNIDKKMTKHNTQTRIEWMAWGIRALCMLLVFAHIIFTFNNYQLSKRLLQKISGISRNVIQCKILFYAFLHMYKSYIWISGLLLSRWIWKRLTRCRQIWLLGKNKYSAKSFCTSFKPYENYRFTRQKIYQLQACPCSQLDYATNKSTEWFDFFFWLSFRLKRESYEN